MSKRYIYLLSGLLLLAVSLAAQTKVIKEVNARSDGTFKGVDLYRHYCAACHGADAKGNGPAASALKAQPTDLTTIARRKNGKFPAIEVQEYIKGDRTVPAHGTLDMPMWGDIFKSVSLNRSFAEMRVNNLVEYLQQIQR